MSNLFPTWTTASHVGRIALSSIYYGFAKVILGFDAAMNVTARHSTTCKKNPRHSPTLSYNHCAALSRVHVELYKYCHAELTSHVREKNYKPAIFT